MSYVGSLFPYFSGSAFNHFDCHEVHGRQHSEVWKNPQEALSPAELTKNSSGGLLMQVTTSSCKG